MTITENATPTDSTPTIRMISLNREKTRKTEKRLRGIDAAIPVYQVYFDLSDHPSQAWGATFENEWNTLNLKSSQSPREAIIDGRSLVIHCPLREVTSIQVPLLKKAVAAANTSYHRHLHELAVRQQQRNDVWRVERKAVDDLADSLKFD
ncbi:MAG TPA: hypothetical protein VNN76_12395 [Bacteroidota bacterium]|nr:hypothetical protein [Bacteroidota bacterium]